MKNILNILFILVNCFSALAQEFNFQFEPAGIPVEIDGWQPFCPWVGGISQSTPEFCDIDADGDWDFFTGNFLGKITYFTNIGTCFFPNLSFITREYANVNISGGTYGGRTSPKFCDIDGDNDFDLFTGDFRGLIHYWENIGTSSEPVFMFVTDSLEYIDVPGYSKLDFKDMDLDGDYDLLIGNYYGVIWYYENIGTPSSFDFFLITEQFANIDVGQNASPCLVDIDSDNDYDLFIGERYGKIWYYRNDGDSVNYDFVYVTDNFEGIDVDYFSSPEFADIDGDGDYDLFVGSESMFTNQVGSVFFYENIGSPTNPQFNLITSNYLSLDTGDRADKLQFIDIDADGDDDFLADLLISILHLENTGGLQEPYFVFVTDIFQGISNSLGIAPHFVDLDADLDYDIISGTGAIPGPPSLSLYINQGTPNIPDMELYNSQYITNPSFYVWIIPVLADIDADGDYDLFISDHDGHFFYYQNDGSPSMPNFTMIDSIWQGITFPYPYDGAKPSTFVDFDGDGDLDLFMENPYNNHSSLSFYKNIGTPQNAVMVLENDTLLQGNNLCGPAPYFVDIDNDSDLDLFIAQAYGGFMFFRNLEVNSVNREPDAVNRSFTLHQNYPNPFNTSTIIPFTIPTASKVNIEVYNLLGQKVAVLLDCQQAAGSWQLTWDAGGQASGVYYVRLQSESLVKSQKVILIK